MNLCKHIKEMYLFRKKSSSDIILNNKWYDKTDELTIKEFTSHKDKYDKVMAELVSDAETARYLNDLESLTIFPEGREAVFRNKLNSLQASDVVVQKFSVAVEKLPGNCTELLVRNHDSYIYMMPFYKRQLDAVETQVLEKMPEYPEVLAKTAMVFDNLFKSDLDSILNFTYFNEYFALCYLEPRIISALTPTLFFVVIKSLHQTGAFYKLFAAIHERILYTEDAIMYRRRTTYPFH